MKTIAALLFFTALSAASTAQTVVKQAATPPKSTVSKPQIAAPAPAPAPAESKARVGRNPKTGAPIDIAA